MNTSFEVLNSFPDSIAILNSDGKILFTNRIWDDFSKQNSGTIQKTGIGVNYLEVCKNTTGKEKDMAIKCHDGILSVIRNKNTVFELEYPCHSHNEQRWFILRANRLSGTNDLFITSHINITQRKLAENLVQIKNEQLHKINERLNLSVYKIAHDIQGPLNSVEGLIYLSKDEKNLEDIEENLQLIEKSVINLKEYIKNTLHLSGQLNESITRVDLNVLIENFISSVRTFASLKNVQINFTDSQNIILYTEKHELLSVISNIITNSIKYSDPDKNNSYVQIKAEINNTEMILSIKDNGLGITADKLSQIFEKNFKTDMNSANGHGIGLYMVKQTIENLKGTINVYSEYGKGTEFIIKLPLHL